MQKFTILLTAVAALVPWTQALNLKANSQIECEAIETQDDNVDDDFVPEVIT